ncbi:MAG: hypothetical protein RLZZ293_1555 [Pseudomonadota bacterium]|jgi:isopenicillin N synthase-like dioxygenase
MQVLQVDYSSANASQDFARSLRETGFAVIKNHPIDYQLVSQVFQEWEQFFNSEYKENYLYKNDTQDGFFPMRVSETALGYEIKDIKEFFHYYPNGQFPKELSAMSKQLYQQMSQVAVQLLTWIEENLPDDIRASLSEPLAQMVEQSPATLMRILHYPPLTGNEIAGAVRAAAHGDINLLTVLVAASQSGLQVKNSAGEWLDVPVDPGMLSINIGDMLELASKGYYKSTIHQVINPTDATMHNSRYSIPLFLHPRPEVKLTNDLTASEMLNQRLVALGVKQ